MGGYLQQATTFYTFPNVPTNDANNPPASGAVSNPMSGGAGHSPPGGVNHPHTLGAAQEPDRSSAANDPLPPSSLVGNELGLTRTLVKVRLYEPDIDTLMTWTRYKAWKENMFRGDLWKLLHVPDELAEGQYNLPQPEMPTSALQWVYYGDGSRVEGPVEHEPWLPEMGGVAKDRVNEEINSIFRDRGFSDQQIRLLGTDPLSKIAALDLHIPQGWVLPQGIILHLGTVPGAKYRGPWKVWLFANASLDELKRQLHAVIVMNHDSQSGPIPTADSLNWLYWIDLVKEGGNQGTSEPSITQMIRLECDDDVRGMMKRLYCWCGTQEAHVTVSSRRPG